MGRGGWVGSNSAPCGVTPDTERRCAKFSSSSAAGQTIFSADIRGCLTSFRSSPPGPSRFPRIFPQLSVRHRLDGHVDRPVERAEAAGGGEAGVRGGGGGFDSGLLSCSLLLPCPIHAKLLLNAHTTSFTAYRGVVFLRRLLLRRRRPLSSPP